MASQEPTNDRGLDPEEVVIRHECSVMRLADVPMFVVTVPYRLQTIERHSEYGLASWALLATWMVMTVVLYFYAQGLDYYVH
jgi:uncharacterized membrane protein